MSRVLIDINDVAHARDKLLEALSSAGYVQLARQLNGAKYLGGIARVVSLVLPQTPAGSAARRALTALADGALQAQRANSLNRRVNHEAEATWARANLARVLALAPDVLAEGRPDL